MGGGQDLQIPGGDGAGVAVKGLTQAGDESVISRRHIATNDDRCRVEQGNPRGQNLAESATALSDVVSGLRVSDQSQVDHVTDVSDIATSGAHVTHQRPSAGDGFEAAAVTAPAGKPSGGGGLDVPEIPCGAERSELHHATGDDPRAEPGGSLNDQRVLIGREVPAAF